MCQNGDTGLVCACVCYFGTEEGLGQAEAIHDVHQVVQSVVEDSVQFFSSESHGLDTGQCSSMQLRLYIHTHANAVIFSSTG